MTEGILLRLAARNQRSGQRARNIFGQAHDRRLDRSKHSFIAQIGFQNWLELLKPPEIAYGSSACQALETRPGTESTRTLQRLSDHNNRRWRRQQIPSRLQEEAWPSQPQHAPGQPGPTRQRVHSGPNSLKKSGPGRTDLCAATWWPISSQEVHLNAGDAPTPALLDFALKKLCGSAGNQKHWLVSTYLLQSTRRPECIGECRALIAKEECARLCSTGLFLRFFSRHPKLPFHPVAHRLCRAFDARLNPDSVHEHE